jgi:alpha/beta superfamily hydrolase
MKEQVGRLHDAPEGTIHTSPSVVPVRVPAEKSWCFGARRRQHVAQGLHAETPERPTANPPAPSGPRPAPTHDLAGILYPACRVVEPYFFGPSGRELFGAYHAPEGNPGDRHGVVICYPFGHEYVNSLRGCRQLATRFSRAGFAALRFDYLGTGDSARRGEDVTLGDWVDDIEHAIADIRRHGRLRSLTLIGIRLGASLAALVGSRRSDVDRVVMWEPVTAGKDHVAELRARHAGFLASEAEAGRSQAEFDTGEEIMGFALPNAFANEMAAIDLGVLPKPPAPHVLVIDDGTSQPVTDLTRRLEDLGARVERRALSGQKIWVREPGQERALVPVPILEAIVSWSLAARNGG